MPTPDPQIARPARIVGSARRRPEVLISPPWIRLAIGLADPALEGADPAGSSTSCEFIVRRAA